jgi:hypothetical protein
MASTNRARLDTRVPFPAMTVTELPDVPSEEDAPEEPPRRPLWRKAVGWGITALACLLVAFALIAPNDYNKYSLTALLRIPIEGLIAVGLMLVLPHKARRIVLIIAGAVLGLLAILKAADLGFFASLYRPFDPVLDWFFIEAGVNYLTVTIGNFGAIVLVILAVIAVIATPVLMVLAGLRLSRIVNRHRTASIRTVAVLGVVWIACSIVNVEFARDLPVASTSASEYVYLHAKQVPDGIRDQREFAKEAAVDAFRDTPPDQLLTSLRGKDVVLTFVESYGRVAIEHPELAPRVNEVLTQGEQKLKAAGFSARSGFLTSPTFGGGSWLAHSTLSSGLWINNQGRYRNLVTTDRFTLNKAFRKAGWRTVGVEPAVIQAWPEGALYGYDKIYAAEDLRYRGPRFSYATMPDQYILSAFQREELAKPGHPPVMAQITTLTSHAPWSPVPALIDWEDVGDGSVYNSMAADGAPPEVIFQRASNQVRADFGRAIVYSLNTVISYAEKFADDNTVLIFLGDHQPAPVVTGDGASHDAPITILAKDPKVLEKVADWGWHDGLKPGPDAPVWRMDTFRDRFLSAFGSR